MFSEISESSGLWLSLSELATPDIGAPPAWLFTLLLLVVVVRFLKVFSYPEKPQVTYCTVKGAKENHRIAEVIDRCAVLNEVYTPPLMWGRNGHIQTATYGILGHASLKRTFDKRNFVKLSDGTTVTFDVFEATRPHPSGRDYTITMCPGIANSSESNYIRTCVHYANDKGFRCAVLNHLGALADVPLTSSHIFSYGGTDELEAMMMRLMEMYRETRFLCVGFSMGANLTTRLLCKMKPEMLTRIVFGLSVGQGYDAFVSAPMYHDWESGRRAYNYIITENVKRLLRRNYDMAVAPHVKSGLIDEQRLWAATSIIALDEHYNRRVHGFSSADDFYRWCSSLPLIPKLRVPMLFLNALDDPIVPPKLWEPVQKLAEQLPDIAFVLMKHGGHLGFLEGTSLSPNSVTWLDRMICELADAAIQVYDPHACDSCSSGATTHTPSLHT
uniref:AB hydrolase-1 domain-containing protein n=1 Tax=Plectus sambesii TaxID=2011161 RepID=A0A914VC60_9BILA